MKNVAWQGVYPALLTPFTPNDTIDYPLFQKNLDAQLAAGVDGMIICGFAGRSQYPKQYRKTRTIGLLRKKH